jgi:hypothetical protein
MSTRDVHKALLVAATSALGAIPVAHENAPYVPPVNAKWAQFFFLPNKASVSTLGSTGQDLVDGIAQITINYPQSTGTATADDDYETIRTSFPAGSHLTSGGQTVKIINCGRGPGALNGNWYSVFITISWFAWIAR